MAGYHLFSTGEVLSAANVNDYLMKQTTMIFASASARTTALSGVLREGMVSYRLDSHVFEVYNGTAWVASETNLTTKGDLAVYSTAPDRLAVGADGTTLVANSANSSGLGWSATPSASNSFLNSAFNVWQRGTSIAYAGGNQYTADRWCFGSGSTGRTISRQVTNDTTNLPNIQYCARVQRDNANTNTAALKLNQSFETLNSIPFAGKAVVISFYARAGANFSAASNLMTGTFYSGTGTDQNVDVSYTGQATVATASATLTTTWQRFTATGTVAATATEIALLFSYTPVGTAGAADYFEVTGVQIDVGSVALPFRTYGATYQAELAACQRYYFLAATGFYFLGATSFYSATEADTAVSFPVTMRIAPSLVASTGTGYYATNRAGGQTTYNSLTIYQPSQNAAMIYGAGSGTAGNSGNTYTANAAASVAFSAEL